MSNVLITHIDLDGIGCAILMTKYYQLINKPLEVYYMNYGDPELKLKEMINSGLINQDLYITDLSADLNFLESLFSYRLTNYPNFITYLIDHHKTFIEEIQSSSILYNNSKLDTNYSGTELVFQYLLSISSGTVYKEIAKYFNFSSLVSDYDLWKLTDPNSVKLQLLYSSNKDYFFNRFLSNPEVLFISEETFIISNEETKIDNTYNNLVSNSIIYTDIENNKFILTSVNSGSKYLSLASSKLLSNLPSNSDISYIAIVTPYEQVSLRSTSYDVGSLAKKLGGGGHTLASGFSISQLQDVSKSLINQTIEVWSKD